MTYRHLALLLGCLSIGFGVLRHIGDEAPLWHAPVLGLVGFAAPYVVGFIIWAVIDPEDVLGVLKEIPTRIRKRGKNA